MTPVAATPALIDCGTARAYDVGVSTDPRVDVDSLSALPSPLARLLAFVGIIVGGLAGGLIGYALVDVQADDPGDVARGIGMLVGGIAFAGGTAIVAILVLRAIGEWRDISDRR